MRLDERDFELLRSLCELRYLSSSQIQEHSYRGTPVETVRGRLWRLCREGLLRRLGVPEALGLPVLSVYRLTADGVATVRNRGLGNFDDYDDVSPQFLRHLVDTNDVFLMLATTATWDALPFVWHGSHRARLSFVQIVSDPRGGSPHERQRQLVPDALVTPKGDPKSARCFLELDRVTEAVGAGPGHNSIERKLRAYRALIHQFIPGKRETAYAVAFRRNPRPARVVFVVATTDARERRVASILKMGHDIAPELDVRAMPLSDVAGIRAALVPPSSAVGVPAAAPRAPARHWGQTTLTQVIELRDAYVEAASDLRNAADTRPDCHDRLKRLALACRGLALRGKDQLTDSDEPACAPAGAASNHAQGGAAWAQTSSARQPSRCP